MSRLTRNLNRDPRMGKRTSSLRGRSLARTVSIASATHTPWGRGRLIAGGGGGTSSYVLLATERTQTDNRG